MTPSTTLGSPPRSPVLPASPVERCRGRPHARPSPLELRRDGKEPADRKPGTRARQHHPARAISMPRGPPPAPQPRPQQKTTAHHADIPSPAAHPAPLDNILLRWWLGSGRCRDGPGARGAGAAAGARRPGGPPRSRAARRRARLASAAGPGASRSAPLIRSGTHVASLSLHQHRCHFVVINGLVRDEVNIPQAHHRYHP
jgi:hypothetical protein